MSTGLRDQSIGVGLGRLDGVPKVEARPCTRMSSPCRSLAIFIRSRPRSPGERWSGLTPERRKRWTVF